MKKILAIMFATLLVTSLFLAGCEKKMEETTDKISVLCTIFPPFDFARTIGGEHIEVQMLMSPGTDSHSYSGDNPTDILKIASCDLFVYIGGVSENAWVENVLSTIENSGQKVPETLCLSSYCSLLEETDGGIIQSDGHSHGIGTSYFEHEHEDGYEDNTGKAEEHADCFFDEHIWTSLNNAKKMAEAIALKLCETDSENSAYYLKNYDDYRAKLQALDSEFSELFENSELKPLIFADRFPFAYFADSYGLECYAAFGGCSTENEPSPTTIANLSKIIEEEQIESIFYIETSKSTVPDALCRATGAEAFLLHSCHTVTERQLREGVTYISLMENNLENLRKALSND